MTTLKPGGIIGEQIGGKVPTDEAGHFSRCAVCGQAVDERDPGQVLHHEGRDHGPLPVS